MAKIVKTETAPTPSDPVALTPAKVKESKCPVTREQFKGKAPRSLTVKFFDGTTEVGGGVAMMKEFSTGSLGYYFGDKLTLPVDGTPCKVQISLNAMLVGSKDLPK